jgi:hypothetical protein
VRSRIIGYFLYFVAKNSGIIGFGRFFAAGAVVAFFGRFRGIETLHQYNRA